MAFPSASTPQGWPNITVIVTAVTGAMKSRTSTGDPSGAGGSLLSGWIFGYAAWTSTPGRSLKSSSSSCADAPDFWIMTWSFLLRRRNTTPFPPSFQPTMGNLGPGGSRG